MVCQEWPLEHCSVRVWGLMIFPAFLFATSSHSSLFSFGWMKVRKDDNSSDKFSLWSYSLFSSSSMSFLLILRSRRKSMDSSCHFSQLLAFSDIWLILSQSLAKISSKKNISSSRSTDSNLDRRLGVFSHLVLKFYFIPCWIMSVYLGRLTRRFRIIL